MTLLVAFTIVSLALVDGAFSGFRASLGRTGLVDHGAQDGDAMKRGTGLVVLLAIPAIVAFVLDVSVFGQGISVYTESGLMFLTVVAPYTLVVAVALGAYAALGWKLKYLASALILGPFTLIRPYVCIAAVAAALLHTSTPGIALTAALATAAVLLVEPVCNRHYAAAATPRPD